MTKAILASTALALGLMGSALAQDAQLPPQDLPQNGGAGARSGHITSTGATVPNPGESQGGGTTSLDRGVQAQDNKIDSGICKGC